MQALLCPRGFRSFCCKMVQFELFSVTGSFRNHSNILLWCSKIAFGCLLKSVLKNGCAAIFVEAAIFQDTLLNTKFEGTAISKIKVCNTINTLAVSFNQYTVM